MKDETFESVRYRSFPATGAVELADHSAVDVQKVSNSSLAPSPRQARAPSFYGRFLKRALDLTLVVISAPFSISLIGFCALALWFEGGNPFYRQARLGKNGKMFSILKLRTMVHDADAVLEACLANDPEMRREWDTIQKLTNDPRITPLGRILRKVSIDELPQLWNVLKGEMSLVGPRPMMPFQLKLYGNSSAYFSLRPGITGMWQVSARNSERFSYRNEIDREYEKSVSFLTDLVILVKTVGVVLRPTGH
ncbi:MAG: sugar transferase [Pseudomonadota bacterium]